MKTGGVKVAGGVVDACVFHEWPGPLALAPYMREGWREMVVREGDPGGPVSFSCAWLYQHPRSGYAASSLASGQMPGTEYGLLKAELLDRQIYDHAVLGYSEALRATAFPH